MTPAPPPSDRDPLRGAVGDLQAGTLDLLDVLAALAAACNLPAECRSERALLEAFLDAVLQAPGLDTAAVYLQRGEHLERALLRTPGQSLGLEVTPVNLPDTVGPRDAPIGRALAREAITHCPDCAREGLASPPSGSLLCAPLGGARDRLGVLVLAHPEPGAFGPLQEGLIRMLAALLAQQLRDRRLLEDLDGEIQARTFVLSQALEHARELRARFEHWALIDDLTGLHNRRFFFSEAETLLQRALRYGEPASVLLLDVDHFKAVNDSFGHARGDEALRAIARRLDLALRRGDVLARFGGEEFVFLLPHTDAAGARAFGERLCRDVADHPLHESGAELRLTISVGVSSLPGAGTSPAGSPTRPDPAALLDRLLREADDALYYGKSKGRNCVYVYPELPGSSHDRADGKPERE